jgi:hypothetical protein
MIYIYVSDSLKKKFFYNNQYHQTTKFMQTYEMLRNFQNKLRKHQNVNI